MAAKTIVRKKANENRKEELLNSLGKNVEDEETEMETANNPTEAIELISHYEEIIRTQHKRVKQYIYTNKKKS